MSDPRLRPSVGRVAHGQRRVAAALRVRPAGALLPPLVQYILAGAFVLAAIIFFGTFARTPADWWRAIPGWTLLGLAAVLVMSTLAVDQLAGATVFFGLGSPHPRLSARPRQPLVGAHPRRLSARAGAGHRRERGSPASTCWRCSLFGGLGAVFFLLFLLHRRQWWAVILAAC